MIKLVINAVIEFIQIEFFIIMNISHSYRKNFI